MQIFPSSDFVRTFRHGAIALLVATGWAAGQEAAAPVEVLPGVERILFLGDSITRSGQYVEAFEAHLLMRFPRRTITVINAGLSSETVSGLSEPGHAGGKFPRPDLHERLGRILALAKPDLVIACYGMNCGLIQPFDATRFARFRQGMEKLRADVRAAGADIVHLTPPVYDPGAGHTGFNYDEVLARYSAWMMERQREDGWRVIDLHSAMREALARRRQADPGFTFAKDRIHPDAGGHAVMARALVAGLDPAGLEKFDAMMDEDFRRRHAAFFQLVKDRSQCLGLAYLGAAGHLRPGIPDGLSVADARARAADLTRQILAELAKDAE